MLVKFCQRNIQQYSVKYSLKFTLIFCLLFITLNEGFFKIFTLNLYLPKFTGPDRVLLQNNNRSLLRTDEKLQSSTRLNESVVSLQDGSLKCQCGHKQRHLVHL